MRRILEPEVMDTQQDAVEYDAMDFVDANTRFAEDALVLLHQRKNAQLLDIGVGTGQIPILMLRRRPDLKILAVDLAQEMLRVASRNVLDAGFVEQCQLAKMDAKSLRVPNAKYDMVMCNSTAHHIPDPLVMFKEIARVVRPDGAIIVRDLLRPDTMDDAWATVKRVAAGEHLRQQQLFFDSLCAALTLDEVQALVRNAGIARMQVRQVSDRHWTAERAAMPSTSSRIPPSA